MQNRIIRGLTFVEPIRRARCGTPAATDHGVELNCLTGVTPRATRQPPYIRTATRKPPGFRSRVPKAGR